MRKKVDDMGSHEHDGTTFVMTGRMVALGAVCLVERSRNAWAL